MAISPELTGVSESLTLAREYMIGEYNNFLSSLGGISPDYFLSFLKECAKYPDATPIIPFRTGAGWINYRPYVAGHAHNMAMTGLSLKLIKEDPSLEDAPELILAGASFEDPTDPLVFSRGWRLKKPGVTNTVIIAENSRIAQIIQSTTRDELVKGPKDTDPNLLTPHQSISIIFWWLEEELFSWEASISLVGDEQEFDLSVKMDSRGNYFKDGDRMKEYELPRNLIMPDVIDNIINQRPALRAAYYP